MSAPSHEPSAQPETDRRSQPRRETRPLGEIVVRPFELVLLAEAHLSPDVIAACWDRDVSIEEKRGRHVVKQ